MNRGLLIEVINGAADDFRKLHKAFESGRKAGVEIDEAVYAKAVQLVEKSRRFLDAAVQPPEIVPEEAIPF